MCNISYICTFVCLAVGLVYGNKCEKKHETDMGCPVFKIESQNQCQNYVVTNDGVANFVFYITPLIKEQLWRLFISLHIGHSHTSREITHNLFTVNINNQYMPHTWYKIKIRRGKGTTQVLGGLFQSTFDTYILEINDQQHHTHPNAIEAGNQIRVKTVTSLWSFTCDPRQYQSPYPPPEGSLLPPQPAAVLIPPLQPVATPLPPYQPVAAHIPPDQSAATPLPSSQPAASHIPPAQPAAANSNTSIIFPHPSEERLPQPTVVGTTKEYKGILDTITNLPVWQLATVSAVTLVSILVFILVTVTLVLRHKRRKHHPALIQPTDNQSRLSHVVDHIYEEVDPQGISATNSVTISDTNSATNSDTISDTNSATSSANQRRGSGHDSENSIYMGFN